MFLRSKVMPENPTPSQPAPQQQASAPAPQYTPGHVPITEEFDKAKWTLPPVVPVLVAVVVVAVVIAVIAFANRPTPIVSGSITKVAGADMNPNVLAAIQVKLNNVIDKQIWVRSIDSELVTGDGKSYKDHAAPASDVDRYIQAFPALQDAKAEPLREELKIPPKTSFTGVTVFSYPVDMKTFDQRKSLTLRIQFYDQPTVVIHQP